MMDRQSEQTKEDFEARCEKASVEAMSSNCVDIDAESEPLAVAFSTTRQLVQQAWQEAFGARWTYPGASIFDIRTGSGRVYRLLSEIKRLTGVSLPFYAVFQASTVCALSSLVAGDPLPEFVSSIPMQPGQGGPPLFMFPGLGGSVFQIFDLARSIRSDGPVYVNQFASLRDEDPPLRTIDALAARQVSAIKQVSSHGPYMLLGYSLGGIVALEVARRLEDLGDTVCFIGMLEPGLPERAWPIREKLNFLGRRLGTHGARLRAMGLAGKFRYFVGHTSSLFGRVSLLIGLNSVGWSPYRAQTDYPELDQLRNANIEALQKYRIKKYHGRVTYIKSEAGDPLACDPLEVWPRYLTDLNVVTVSGAHETMLRGRNAVALAASISSCVENARMAGACSTCIKGAAA